MYVSDLPDIHAPGAKVWTLGTFGRPVGLASLERYTVQKSFDLSPAISPRFYSIASSPLVSPDVADLIVGTSAGSTVGAQLRTGKTLDGMFAAQLDDNHGEISPRIDVELVTGIFGLMTDGGTHDDEQRRRRRDFARHRLYRAGVHVFDCLRFGGHWHRRSIARHPQRLLRLRYRGRRGFPAHARHSGRR